MDAQKEGMAMVKRTNYVHKRMAHARTTTNQMRLPFGNDIELAPPPAVLQLSYNSTTSGSNYREE